MESAAHANATSEPNALRRVPFVGLDGHVIMLLYYGHPDDLRCVTVISQSLWGRLVPARVLHFHRRMSPTQLQC
ncbi:hypothetical protein CY34DRAFT_814545 [Suillus luteus UH-Slu-Lm8-n1]|uniref:Uncharacterized protein n=1 Tax=Suillus luteus UH-Slu-Lm8-n1 TaxID=930992 RepID=A0A0D0ABR9_9AGAM|nr:hypothetical protein CY34DRAFT_814545 [Suillus luteus UH-Slu-Lm8-n1]